MKKLPKSAYSTEKCSVVVVCRTSILKMEMPVGNVAGRRTLLEPVSGPYFGFHFRLLATWGGGLHRRISADSPASVSNPFTKI